MEVIEILKEVSKQVYDNVKNLAGTEDAAGDFGRGAGGDISRKTQKKQKLTFQTLLNELQWIYLKKLKPTLLQILHKMHLQKRLARLK